jgi:DNA-directed RNA polymerase sigma subunit (sigma70/sigma32)
MPFRLIAKQMNLSEQRVRQLYDRALRKMIKAVREDAELLAEFDSWKDNLDRKLPVP